MLEKVLDVVWVILLLTFTPFSSACIVDFEKLNVSWNVKRRKLHGDVL